MEEQLAAMSDNYAVAYKGREKQFIVKKLTPSTLYAFRVQCENALGASTWSLPALIYTSGCVPEPPAAPQLIAATTNSLTLGSWASSSSSATTLVASALDYELQMHALEDALAASHGFLTVYHGRDETYQVRDLKRAMAYLFRVRAKNEEGYGGWSETVKFRTNADAPRPPTKLKVNSTLII